MLVLVGLVYAWLEELLMMFNNMAKDWYGVAIWLMYNGEMCTWL